jgi:DNA-binding transcriptional regulator WhiA
MYTFKKFGRDYSLLKPKAVSLFHSGLNCKQIAKELEVYRKTVGKWLREAGCEYSKVNKAKVNSSVFNKIDTEEKAYWLGFIFADGYVSKSNNFELSLGLKDLEHLTRFKEFLQFEGKIYIDQKVGRCRLQFQDAQIVNSLKKIGCVNKKSLVLMFPKINECFYSHFIRGYFDGDGSINKPEKSISVSIVGTQQFLEFIHNLLNIPNYKIKHRQIKHSKEVHISEFSGNDARNFGKFIYNNSTICLERKKERFVSHLNKKL